MTYGIRTAIPPGSTSGSDLADIVEEVGDLTQIVVLSDTTNQPASPSEGDAYIVNGDASWGGAQYDIAVFRDATWIYHTPEEGWVAYIKDRGEARRFNATDWNTRIPGSSPEHATDSGTDTFVSETNTDKPKAGDRIDRDFQSANTTTTPTLDSLTITTKDGSGLWAGALSGVHKLQLNAGGTAWLVLDPKPRIPDSTQATSSNTANAVVQRDGNGRAKFSNPSAAQDAATKASSEAYTDTQVATRARIATGTYTGDGTTSQSITGIGFQPQFVKIWEREGASGTGVNIFETTAEIVDDDGSGMSILHAANGAHETRANRIISLDADGFTVDDDGGDSTPNTSGASYNYMAIG